MDVKVGAEIMEIGLVVELATPVITTTVIDIIDHNIEPSLGPAFTPVISVGNHSISAIAPDFELEKELATV